MFELKVGKMTCGGCANRVTQAVLAVDSDAKVDVDLKSKLVRVESCADAAVMASAISNAGYPATAIRTTA